MSTEQVKSTNTEALQDFKKLAHGNVLGYLRKKRSLEIEIASLNRRITELRLTDSQLKRRVYNNLTMAAVDERYKADDSMTIKPVQVLDYIDIGYPGPHHTIAYDKNKLSETVREILVEISKLESEIKSLNATVRSKQARLDNINNILEANKKSKNPDKPVEKDLEKDRIAKTKEYYINLLYNMSFYYAQSTRNNAGNRAFPEDVKMVKALLNIQQQFRCFTQGMAVIDKDFATGGKKELDVVDPGAANNIYILGLEEENLRTVSRNDKVFDQVLKYSDKLTATLNNTLNSRGTDRKAPLKVATDNKFKKKNEDWGKGLSNFIQSWSEAYNTDITAGARKMWQKKTSRLYVGLPPCPDALPDLNKNDEVKAFVEAEDAKNKAEGAKEYANLMAKSAPANLKLLQSIEKDRIDLINSIKLQLSNLSNSSNGDISKQQTQLLGDLNIAQQELEQAQKAIVDTKTEIGVATGDFGIVL